MTSKIGKALQIILQEFEDKSNELDIMFLMKQVVLKESSFEHDIEIQPTEIKMNNTPGRWGQYLGRK